MSGKIQSSPSVKAFFIGGVGDEVTGSSTLLKITRPNGEEIFGLIDAGAPQGKSEYLKYEYPLSGKLIDFVVLTHGHYDHTGMVPLLYKRGFKGKVYATSPVKSISEPLLTDAAKINEINSGIYGKNKKTLQKEEDHLIAQRELTTSYKEKKSLDSAISQFEDIKEEAVYTIEDVIETMELFTPVQVFQRFQVADDVYVRIVPTTHQFGAGRVEVYIGDAQWHCNIAFSGDIGPKNSLLYDYRDHFYNPDIDYFVLESLHGYADPDETLKTSIKRLKEIVEKGIRQRKHIVLVGFSLDRNAMLVYLMNQLMDAGIKVDTYIDSPLTMRMLSIYTSGYQSENAYFKNLGLNPFDLKHIRVIGKSAQHALSVTQGEAPRAIITASANGGGGRVVDYFENGIQRDDYVFVFCGWLNPDSPSAHLCNAKIGEICEVNSTRFVKKCKTYNLLGFSSHGYYNEMLEAINDYPQMKKLILNHADYDVKVELKKHLALLYGEENIYIPDLYAGYSFEEGTIREMDDDETYSEFEKVLERDVFLDDSE